MNGPEKIPADDLKLYEKRKSVHPQRIDGTFRRLKWAIMIATLAIYYVTPWIRWDRGPYAPDQAVLIDIANRRFYMFGIEIWSHEFYYVAGLLVMAGIGLFLVTTAVGRAWCGYACPQTVWTDLFQHVDRFVDGDRNKRMRLDKAPWTASKTARRLFKWGIYLFIAFWTGGAWIMYFADAPTLTVDFWTGQAHYVAYVTVAILTATTFILGGFMREQVCVYMCPWPRIQAAMMDEKSLLVTYKDWRGEKRGSVKKAVANPGEFGDCIDCNQCVAVCPTGIDIREGPQIGCITCALCIDACDRVMGEVGRPRGLIDYVTADDVDAEQAGEAARPAWKNLLRIRILLYFLVWAGIGLAMLFALGNRTRLDLAVQHDRNPVYVQLSNGDIRNTYTAKIRNMENRPRDVEITIDRLADATVWEGGTTRIEGQRSLKVTVPADSVANVKLFIATPESASGRDEFTMTISGRGESAETDTEELFFERPKG